MSYQTEFRVEKIIKKKGNKWYVKWKGYDNSFNSWIYYPEPDLSNYETKSDLKGSTGIYTAKFAKRIDLSSVKSRAIRYW